MASAFALLVFVLGASVPTIRPVGATLEEIKAVLASGDPVPAKQGRSYMRKLFQVDEVRQGKRYSQKTVEVYHVVEGDVIVVVTVYVFFGGWES